MLKKINVKQIRLGMHLKEFCGSWMDHPFWRNGFVLKDIEDLQLIQASNIKEVWIDCAKGVDVADGEVAISEAKTDVQVDTEIRLAAATEEDMAPVPASAEYRRASKICRQSKRAVSSMFGEARLGKAVDTGFVKKLVKEISASIMRNPNALISLARLKTADDYTYMHSVAVCALMVALARQLGLNAEQTQSAGEAGLLHDLGKSVIPLEVLNKPGKLTDEEFAVIKTHPEEGLKLLLGSTGADEVALDVVLHHHEKLDGTGYPKRLKGPEISLFAKMGAVCDIYDAITSNRPYKTEWDPADSLSKMATWTDSHLDADVFRAFVRCVGIYPVGSLVKLESGRLGVVTEQSRNSLLKPVIKVFYSTLSHARIKPRILDLSVPGCQEKISGREDPGAWNFPDLNELCFGVSASRP
jgi:putative nucleotidyltransferase with HDIG domain